MSAVRMNSRRLSIALVCDFFHPAVGGAEVHLYQLGSHLALLGHRVIIVTHATGNRKGIRYLESGLKCYHLPQLPFYNNTSFPTIFSTLPMLRDVFVRERIQIVHGHSAFSVLAHEALMHAKLLGLATCFTDHSLFGFQDASAILTNKLLQASLCLTRVICVSHTSKQNTVLRAHLDPTSVRVISNSIDCEKFVPDRTKRRSDGRITVAFCARLEMRKGADLLAQVIAPVCERLPHVDFVIAGDGRKRPLIEEIRDVHLLRDRVTLLGNLQHTQVPALLQSAHVFLNCSLTEAFCMAILEAASCGCHVVSTNVGGIPEVLPPDLITLAEPNAHALVNALVRCIENLDDAADVDQIHARIAAAYDWNTVARDTESVYREALLRPPTHASMLHEYQARCGAVFGKVFCMLYLLDLMLLWVLQWLRPDEDIEEAPPWLRLQ